ncbi:MAG: hypothetical protein IKA09_10645 [Lachnospiraceae bacterium]|nr:hypothetical protein [Lachnospiraceae bacterium]
MMKENENSLLFRFINVLMWGYLAIQLSLRFAMACRELLRNNGWGVTEYYINYQGGYVRRGLIGEIIFQLTTLVPDIDPRWYIAGICLVSIVLVVVFMLKHFRKENLCWWVLPLSVCLMGAFEWIRKDFLCVVLVISIFKAYYGMKNIWRRYIVVMLLLGVGLNVHECLFFMCVPFLMWSIWREDSLNCVCRWLSLLTPVTLMVIVCLCKGDADTASRIWKSWGVIFPEYSSSSPACSVAAIGWDTLYAVKYHLESNFLTRSGIFYGWYSKPLAWCAIFYMTVNVLYCRRDYISVRESAEVRKMLSLLIFQFVALLPMFTVLSCDSTRICFYWLVSSFSIYFVSGSFLNDNQWPSFYVSFTQKLQGRLFTKRSYVIGIVLMLFCGMSTICTDVKDAFYNSVIGRYFSVAEKLIEILD